MIQPAAHIKGKSYGGTARSRAAYMVRDRFNQKLTVTEVSVVVEINIRLAFLLCFSTLLVVAKLLILLMANVSNPLTQDNHALTLEENMPLQLSVLGRRYGWPREGHVVTGAGRSACVAD